MSKAFQKLTSTINSDCVIVGGGVIGLSCAYYVSKLGINCILVEKSEYFGSETSTRNSQVIHSGIYYQKNSLKSKLCIEGKSLLYDYLKSNNIPYNNSGKLIFAKNDIEKETLVKLYNNAKECRVEAEWLNHSQIEKLEPNLLASNAILSKSTGFFDVSLFIEDLLNKLYTQSEDIILMNNCKVENIRNQNKNYYIKVNQKLSENNYSNYYINCKIVINCAGLHSHELFNHMMGKNIYKIKYVKGQYFKYNTKIKLFSKLVYPLPNENTRNTFLYEHETKYYNIWTRCYRNKKNRLCNE